MTIRTILVPVDGSPRDHHSLAVAGSLAQRFSAHAVALYADPDPTDLLSGTMFDVGGGAYFTEELFHTIERQAADRRATAKKTFSEWRSTVELPEAANPGEAENGSMRLLIEVGPVSLLTRKHAMVSDLVVAALPGRDDIDRSVALEIALIDAGRAVLALPQRPSLPSDEAPIVIAWNDSAESARALSAALPLIRDAARVLVVRAGRPDDAQTLPAVISYLAWHGIRAESEELGHKDDPEILIAERAAHLGASLLVMGAYTHSRAREIVFGGVTRYMIKASPVPLLLAH